MKTNLYEIENFFREELIKAGVRFTSDGYPIFQEEWILYETPKYIYPYEHRNATTDKKNTVLCFFMNDKPLYKRIIKLPDDLNNYRDYLGVIGFDLSPVIGWQTDYQRFNILLSQLATAYLGINGIKIIPNFRIGNILIGYNKENNPKFYPKDFRSEVGMT